MIFSLSSYVFAEDILLINIEEKEGTPGNAVTLNVDIAKNPGILALLFDITYDQERLELLSAEDKKLVPGGMFGEAPEQYPYTCLYNSASTTDTKDTGTLFTLTFRIKDTAKPGKAFVKLDYTSGNIFNVNLDEVAVNISGGGIIIPDKENNSTSDNVSGGTGGSHSGGGGNKKASAKTSKDKEENEQATKTNADKIILAIGKTEATVFGEIKHNDVAPILKNSRTMLPARFVAESLGAKVFWNEKEEKVTVKKDNTTILIYIGSDKAYINGEEKILDSPAFIENDRTYTPLRFIVEGLGAKVEWIEQTMEVVITR